MRTDITLQSTHKARSISVSPAAQVGALLLLVLLAGLALAATLGLADSWRQSAVSQSALAEREAQVAHDTARLAASRDEIDVARVRLEQRQSFLEQALAMLPADEGDEDPSDGSATNEAITDFSHGHDLQVRNDHIDRQNAAAPGMRGFARIEQRQLASVAMLTRYGEQRAARAEQAMRRLGLEPRRLIAASEPGLGNARGGIANAGKGGPLETLASEPDGSLDPRFERLASALARMNALEQGLISIPQVMPTQMARMTSGFGYRSDPFTGTAAMHSGLDFGGRLGEPILAAAAGRVVFAGTKGGYGQTVEIAHGNGLLTRYAHLSGFTARAGQQVAAGQQIGMLGSTGRSTGPHLHFEVRLNGRAIDPRPMLEQATHVLAEARSGG